MALDSRRHSGDTDTRATEWTQKGPGCGQVGPIVGSKFTRDNKVDPNEDVHRYLEILNLRRSVFGLL